MWGKVILSQSVWHFGEEATPTAESLVTQCPGKSYFKRRSPGPERPEVGLHQSVREKVTLSEGLRTIGFPEGPEAGLHQSVWEKVALIRSVCNFHILSKSDALTFSQSVWHYVVIKR